jgi:hypothetical protein
MDKKALLSTLEDIHALTSQGILALRERIENEGRYTSAALAELDARLASRIGEAQVLADQVPDYRAFAPQAE